MPFPLLRSETVKKGTIITSTESAYRTVVALGQYGNIHLEDENTESMIRPYNSILQRLDQIDQKLAYVHDQLSSELQIEVYKDNVYNFLQNGQDAYNIDGIEASISYHYERMKVFSTNNSYFMNNKYSLLEELGLLSLSPSFFHEQSKKGSTYSPMNTSSEQGFTVICGTIPSELSQRFMRAITMLAHTNVLVLGEQITDTFKLYDKNFTELKKMKNKKNDQNIRTNKYYDFAFFIYFHGYSLGYLYQSLMKLINVFEAHIYQNIPDKATRQEKIVELISALEENKKATDAFHSFISNEMDELTSIVRAGGNSLIEEWKLYVEREKLIYSTLNKFQGSDATLRISCWLLAKDEDNIRDTLSRISESSYSDAFLIVDNKLPEKSQPPTYLRSNDFFYPFQLSVDTYGVPRYKEVNPGLFTVIPFPFLFAVMFGDVGHGFILFFASLMIFMMGNKGPMSGVYIMRYFFLFLGLFSMFTGSLYNEFFGIGIDLFGGRYTIDSSSSSSHEAYYIPMEGSNFPYPWGLDPLWRAATNELTFLNSFKMKFSIIAGCVQMVFGIILKGVNCIYFNKKIDLILVFIPQMIFFLGFVGYLVFLIFFKWLTSGELYNKPSLINTFIGVFLMTPISETDILFSSQAIVQQIILYSVFICIPILILGKPIVETLINKYMEKKHLKINKSEDIHYSNISTNYNGQNNDESTSNNNSPPSTNTSSPTSTPPMTSTQPIGNLSYTNEEIIEETQIQQINVHTPNNDTRLDIKTDKKNLNDSEDEDHSFGGLLTHSFMESTEFLLGALSNTASYLRLWALSLAHAELTKIILDQLFMMFLTLSYTLPLKCILLFFGSIVFVWCTTVVIMMMDLIEAILHGIRLQWVEFQNKFYAADGIPFQAFSFETALTPNTGI